MQLRTERAVFLFTLFLMLSAFAAGQYSGDLTAEITGFVTGEFSPAITGYADKDFDAWNFEDADGQTGKTAEIVFKSIGIELWSFIILFTLVAAAVYFAAQTAFSKLIDTSGPAFPTLLAVALGLSTSGYYVFWKNFNAFEVFAGYGFYILIPVFSFGLFSVFFGEVKDDDFTKKAGRFSIALLVTAVVSFTAGINSTIGVVSGIGGVICLGIWIYGLIRGAKKGVAALRETAEEKAQVKINKAETLLDKHINKTNQEYMLDKSIDALVEKIENYAKDKATFPNHKTNSRGLSQRAQSLARTEIKVLTKQIKLDRKELNAIKSALDLIKRDSVTNEKNDLVTSYQEFRKVLTADEGILSQIDVVLKHLRALEKAIINVNAGETLRICALIRHILLEEPVSLRRDNIIAKDVRSRLHHASEENKQAEAKNNKATKQEESVEKLKFKDIKEVLVEIKKVKADFEATLGFVKKNPAGHASGEEFATKYGRFMNTELAELNRVFSDLKALEKAAPESDEAVKFANDALKYASDAFARFEADKRVAKTGKYGTAIYGYLKAIRDASWKIRGIAVAEKNEEEAVESV